MSRSKFSNSSSPAALDYVDVFSAATGLPVSLQSADEIYFDSKNLPDFCRRLLSQRKTCALCKQAHKALQGDAPRTAKCFAGLTSSATPIVVRGKISAYLHTGHAAVNDESSRPLLGVPRKSRRQYDASLQLLELFSRQLAEGLPENVHGAPYPAIDRAARSIKAHPEKRWRLYSLARAAKMNPSYFSQMFHRRLGVTLTDFIVGTRLDRAKQLLRYSDLKVIEIAHASGFGSISQFNRAFSAITGTTPSQFRKK